MLFKLSVDGEVPKFFSKLSKRVVPNVAILTISFWIFLGFVVNELMSIFSSAAQNIFVIVYSSSVLPGMVPWFIILLSELHFRKEHPEQLKDHPFKMPLYPAYNYFSLIALTVILLFMFFNPDTRGFSISWCYLPDHHEYYLPCSSARRKRKVKRLIKAAFVSPLKQDLQSCLLILLYCAS